jgi:hypothetical protein
MSNPGATFIATHMLLPAWWVRAFESALLSEQGGMGAIDQALRAQLSPALQPLEMGALAAVLGAVQEQILGGNSRSLKLEIPRYVKEAGAGAGAKTKRYAYEKIAQILTAVKVMEPTSSGIVGRPLFSGESWILGGPNGRDVTFMLTPGTIGLELLLGISDIHIDFLRRLRHEEVAHTTIGSQGPLMVWKSLWLEMTGIEPLLYLRLERAMQWEFKWLQLDGTFGLPMNALFHGLEPDFGRQLKILSRLGKRFEGHGFIAQVKSDQYLAFSPDDASDPTLVWQIGRERLSSDVLSTYCTLAHKALITHHLGPNSAGARIHTGALAHLCERMIRVFLPREATIDDFSQARNTWETLFRAAHGETSEPTSLASLQSLPLESSHFLSTVVLFFELLLRSVDQDQSPSSNPLAVPEIIVHSPLGSLFSSQNPLALEERLKAFESILQDSTELIQAFCEYPLATLTSKVSQKDLRLISLLEDKARSSLSHESLTKPLLIKPREPEESSRTILPPPMPTTTSSAVGVDKEPSAATVAQPSQNSSTPPPASSPSSRIMKIAADELQKIKKNHPERYAELKKAYLDSLDEGGRKLIYDVQKQMQSHLFEEHLRQRILRFMVENPGAWRSAESSFAKNT